jgi:hypothetical protein
MKRFTVEILKQVKTGQLEIAGRNCLDSILVGDELAVEGRPDSVVRVTGIVVYRKDVLELYHGYVGTLFVTRISGDDPRLEDVLIS